MSNNTGYDIEFATYWSVLDVWEIEGRASDNAVGGLWDTEPTTSEIVEALGDFDQVNHDTICPTTGGIVEYYTVDGFRCRAYPVLA